MTGVRLAVASFVLLLAAGMLLFWSVWAGGAAFAASVLVQLTARRRSAKEELPLRRSVR